MHSSNNNMPISLYQKVLGVERFSKLPLGIQRLHILVNHNIEQKYIWVGHANVYGESGILPSLLRKILSLPSLGKSLPTSVCITKIKKKPTIKISKTSGEIWERNFFGHLLTTFQYTKKDHILYEKIGFIHLGFRLNSDYEHLSFKLVSVSLGGVLLLPRFLMPDLIAHEKATMNHEIEFHVEVNWPALGLYRLIAYEGLLHMRS
jgi:hypothetical protein